MDFDTPGNPTYRQELNCIYPLGVNWGKFTAQHVAENVVLDWETLSEKNAAYFSIEHAGEDFQFQSIGTVECAGTTDQHSFYQFTDRSPANGMNYYRLRQYDLDGQWNYSTIAAVDFNSNTLSAAYRRELQQLVFSQPLPAESTVTIYSGSGQLVHSAITGEQQQVVNCQLPVGILLVKVGNDNGQTQFLRVFVQ